MKKPAQEPNASNVIHPEIWPEAAPPFPPNPALEAKLDAILSKMTLEQKVGQIIQADSSSITPEDLKTYKLGSILSGGNSGPNGKPYGSAADWLAMLDAFYDAEMQGPDGEVMIPPLFGIDAVHGHNNVIGATIFPHNIGLGATRDPKLIRHIAEATAIELSVTGHDWTFAPTLTVPRDDRWGRTYEGFSENPDVVRSYAAAIVDGLQGDPGTPGFLGAGKVVASAKHFLADGGTDGGRDQGDASIDEEGLRDIHGAGYPPAVEAGVQTVMASFSSWRGVKMHGDKPLLTGVLKRRMHFDGFIVGDWNAHGQLPGCTTTDCPSALLAGLDMYMAPDSWRELYDSTLKEVRGGAIPMARLDDAVRRILRVKFRAGLFDKGRPSSRPYAGRTEYLGSPEHRAIARQAVRESLVLLKNNHGVLPLDPSKHILVVGESANSIASQCGGWTLTWQGTGLSNDLFPHGETILEGFQKAAAAAGGAVVYSADGKYEGKPDAAIFVFGEQPYAEFQGDIPNVNFGGRNAAMLDRMRALKKAGVPVISVFISGRPLWVNPEMNASDAFVAAWLPGTEGGGVADVLLRKPDGRVNYGFTGKLSYSWPASPTQTPLNVGDPDYAPLFPFGFGLTYQASAELGVLPEDAAATAPSNTTLYFAKGGAPAPFHLYVGDGTAESPADGPEGASPKGGIAYKAASRQAQDDSKSFVWRAGKTAYLKIAGTAPLDLSRQTNGDMTLSIEARVDNAPSGPVMLSVECGEKCRAGVDIADRLSQAGAWRRVDVSLRCFAAKGASMNAVTAPFRIDATGPLAITVSQIELRQDPGDALECGR
ncbi:MAG: 1,4-beta-D-glucan glucohydrolase [Alphaproteobacteria bacterium]|nr:1,4-beta-D-glucan glucohydrolase [Alphaproteobacteria bacterium]